MTGRLQGKIALITGASHGIGAAVAAQYAREGATLVLAGRTVGALEETDDVIRGICGHNATLVAFDLAEPGKIEQLAVAVLEKFGKLDVLVGNAAILGDLTPLHHATDKMWQNVMEVNLTANWRLIRAFHPLLLKSDAGRSIFTTSGAARAAFAYWGAYAVSKAGLEMLVRTYAAECEKTKLRTNLIDPGVVATRLRAQAFPGEDPSTLAKPEDVTELFVELAQPGFTGNGKVYRV